MRETTGEVRTKPWATLSQGPFHTDVQVLDDKLELIYNSSVRTLDLALKIGQNWWIIETNGERESGKSMHEMMMMMIVWSDDGSIIIIMNICKF